MADRKTKLPVSATDENVESEIAAFGVAVIYRPDGDGAQPYLLDPRKCTFVAKDGVRVPLEEAETHIGTKRYNDGYAKGHTDGGAGKITMNEARDLASTYDGGEGHHPLARHRDSMG